MKARLAALLAGVAGLGACNQLGGSPIDMANPPRMKAGLWVMSGALEGEPVRPMQECSAGDVSILPPKDPACSQQLAARTPDGSIDYHAVCNRFGQTLRVHRHIVGDISSAFTADTNSVVQKPGAADINLSSHFQYRYHGACPPGMKGFRF